MAWWNYTTESALPLIHCEVTPAHIQNQKELLEIAQSNLPYPQASPQHPLPVNNAG